MNDWLDISEIFLKGPLNPNQKLSMTFSLLGKLGRHFKAIFPQKIGFDTSDDIMKYFLNFSQEIGFHILCKLSPFATADN